MQGIKKHAAKVGSRPAEGGAQIGTPNVSDEQSVASQHSMRLRIACVQIVNDDGD